MRTTQRLTMIGILGCTALVGGVAFVAWPDERPTAAVADGAVQERVFPSPTASASSSPARSNRAERASAVRTVHPRDHHTPASIPAVEQQQGQSRSATSPTQQSPTHPKQGPPTQQPAKQPGSTSPPPALKPLPGPRFDAVTSSDDSQVDISADRHAVTVGFSAFELKVSGDKAGTRHATKTVPVVFRMAKGTRQGRVRVVVQGYAFTEGARGSLTISGGDRQASHWFGNRQDDSFMQSLDVPAAPGSTVRVSITVDVQLFADSKDGFGDMTVDTVDAEFI